MARLSGNWRSTALSLPGVLWAVTSTAHAQGLTLPKISGIPSTFLSIDSAFGTVWNTVVGVAGIAFLSLLLYGGFLYLTSAGNDTIAERGKHTIRDAAIGITLVVFAWPIGVAVLNFFGQAKNTVTSPSSGLQIPSATSTTPLNPTTTSGGTTGTNTGTGTTPPTTGTNTQTGTTPPTTTPAPTTSTAKPNSTFTVHQPGQQPQTVTVGSTGQASSYSLSAGTTSYASTDMVFVQSQNQNLPAQNLVVNIYRQSLPASQQLMYENASVDANGRLNLDLPVGEQVKITNAATGAELAKDQAVQSGTQIKVVVP